MPQVDGQVASLASHEFKGAGAAGTAHSVNSYKRTVWSSGICQCGIWSGRRMEICLCWEIRWCWKISKRAVGSDRERGQAEPGLVQAAGARQHGMGSRDSGSTG